MTKYEGVIEKIENYLEGFLSTGKGVDVAAKEILQLKTSDAHLAVVENNGELPEVYPCNTCDTPRDKLNQCRYESWCTSYKRYQAQQNMVNQGWVKEISA